MPQVESQRAAGTPPPLHQGSGARRTLSFLSVVPIVLDQRVAGKQNAISSCCRSTGCSCIALPTHLAQNKEHLIRLLVTCVCVCVDHSEVKTFQDQIVCVFNVSTVCVCICCVDRAISR